MSCLSPSFPQVFKANKEKLHWKLPAWFGGCQPEYLGAPGGAVGLRPAAEAVLAGAGLTSAFSWRAGMLLAEAAVKAAGWVASRESLFGNEGGGKNEMHFLLGPGAFGQRRCGATPLHPTEQHPPLRRRQGQGGHPRRMLGKLYFQAVF